MLRARCAPALEGTLGTFAPLPWVGVGVNTRQVRQDVLMRRQLWREGKWRGKGLTRLAGSIWGRGCRGARDDAIARRMLLLGHAARRARPSPRWKSERGALRHAGLDGQPDEEDELEGVQRLGEGLIGRRLAHGPPNGLGTGGCVRVRGSGVWVVAPGRTDVRSEGRASPAQGVASPATEARASVS